MGKVCQHCGDEGVSWLLIVCQQCRDSVVHHYCLDKFSPEDDEIHWNCEDCVERDVVSSSPKKRKLIPGMDRDERKNITCNFFNQKELPNKKDDTKREVGPSCDQIFPLKKENNKTEMRNVGATNRAQKTIPIMATKKTASCDHQPLECDYDMNVLQPVGSFEANTSSSSISNSNVGARKSSYYHPSTIHYSKDHAQPIIDPVWRGNMVIDSEKCIALLAAHLSTTACPKVVDAAKTLAPTIHVNANPRRNVWPSQFLESPPTDESIALYFFPESDSEKHIFDRLLDEIIKKDSSLKCMVGSAELLIFPSHKLPPNHSRFKGKYYLWGIFRNKQEGCYIK